jgi:hypothetical protein
MTDEPDMAAAAIKGVTPPAGRVFDCDDPEGVIGVLIAQREVFPDFDAVRSKAVSRLVVLGTVPVVVEDPPCVLAAAGLVNQHAGLVVLASPEAAYPASLAV